MTLLVVYALAAFATYTFFVDDPAAGMPLPNMGVSNGEWVSRPPDSAFRLLHSAFVWFRSPASAILRSNKTFQASISPQYAYGSDFSCIPLSRTLLFLDFATPSTTTVERDSIDLADSHRLSPIQRQNR